MLALAIFVTYGLQCYVAVDIAWNEYLGVKFEQNKRQLFWEYFTRTFLVLVTCKYPRMDLSSPVPVLNKVFILLFIPVLLAVAVPKLDLFISLFGALCLAALGMAFPAFIDTLTYWHQYNSYSFVFMIFKNSILVCFGIFGLIIGTYTSLHDIIVEFSL